MRQYVIYIYDFLLYMSIADIKKSFSQKMSTPWKINMEPKNGCLEYDFPFQLGYF